MVTTVGRQDMAVSLAKLNNVITSNPDKMPITGNTPIIDNMDYGRTFTPRPSCPKGRTLREATINMRDALTQMGVRDAEVKTAAARKLFEAGLKQKLDAPCLLCYEYEKQLTGFNSKPIGRETRVYKSGGLDKYVGDIQKTGILRGYGVGDFEAQDVPSIIRLGHDLAKHKLGYGQYTKNLLAVEMLGDTGLKFNISTGKNNKIGIPLEVAEAYRKRYPNAGTVYVATDVADMTQALKDPRVDHVIPAHLGGGTPSSFLKNATGMDIMSFQSVQTEMVDGVVLHSPTVKAEYGEKVAAAKEIIRKGSETGDGKKYLAAVRKASAVLGAEITPKFADYVNLEGYGKLIGTGGAEYGQTADIPRIDMSKVNLDKARLMMTRTVRDTSPDAVRYGEIAAKIAAAAKRGGVAAVNALDAKYLSVILGLGVQASTKDEESQ